MTPAERFQAEVARSPCAATTMQRFDRLHDYVFTDQYGLTQQQIVDIRRRLADWPRTPGR